MTTKKKDYNVSDYLIHGIYFSMYGLVKYIPSPVGDIFRALITRPFLKKSGKIRIYEGVTFWYPYRIKIGNDVTFNEWVYISGYGDVEIGNNVRIGHGTSIISSDHNIPAPGETIKDAGLSKGKIIIKDNVFIGAKVTILKGITIGEGSVIGAGSVVTRDVPSNIIVAGNPATIIKERT